MKIPLIDTTVHDAVLTEELVKLYTLIDQNRPLSSRGVLEQSRRINARLSELEAVLPLCRQA